MYRLIVDDERLFDFGGEYTQVCDTQEAIRYIEDYEWDELWLDHDLGIYGNIRPLVLWLEKMGHSARENGPSWAFENVGKIFIHTSNPVGAEWMMAALEKYYEVERIDPSPFLLKEG